VLTVFAGCSTTSDVHSTRSVTIGAGTQTETTAPGTSSPGTTSPGTTAPTGSTGGGQGGLKWGPCKDPSVTDAVLQCATVTVPLDYDHPTGDSIDMALIRVPAKGTRKGAVLFNPGGPGASGFEWIAIGGTTVTATLGIDSFDLIGFDPRGVDRSAGLHCVTDAFEEKHLYIDDTPDTPEEQVLKDEADKGFVDACKQKYGDTLRFFSTANTARDMDAIRVALGDRQISYLGGSYGTYLGAVYATMFPNQVRAMVLDSAYEPTGDTVEQQFESQIVGFEGAFDNWIKWCESDSTCAFTATDVGARWDALKQQLDDHSISGTDGRLANNATMEDATFSALYSRSDWPVLGEALAKAERGDPSGILALADADSGRRPDGTFNTLMQSIRVINCASGIGPQQPTDPEALAAAIRTAAPRLGKDTTAQDLTAQAADCNTMVGHVDAAKVSYSGAGPIVVVGGANDPATPIRWAQKMIGELGPNARLVTFTGEGHGQLLASSCVAGIEGALLTRLKLPAAGTTCDPDSKIGKPDWWDALPVPDGFSQPVSLPAVASAIGAEQAYGEIRTTTMSAKDAVAAYTAAMIGADFQQFDTASAVPYADSAQGVYADISGRAVGVIAMGPKAFDDEALQSAKFEVPPNTTVVWVFAVPI
jgi:pimeloyl-ACP methyl ester carboxylesterase